MQIEAWLKDNSERLKEAAQARQVDRQTVLNALAKARDFIKKNRLIVYGGYAADLVLRLKGSRIYPDDALPDYDVYSPDPTRHAYEFADILTAARFENVSAIKARHVQTMRVRVNFIVVFETTYMPDSVFQTFPTVECQGFRAIHPEILRCGFHRVLSSPYDNPPYEEIGHRFRNALDRFGILAEHYPVAPADSFVLSPSAVTRVTVALADSPRFAIHGVASFCVLCESLVELVDMTCAEEVANDLYRSHPWVKRFGDIGVAPRVPSGAGKRTKWTAFSFVSPFREFDVISDDPRAAAETFAKASKQKTSWRRYYQFLDYRPSRIVVDSGGVAVSVFSSRHTLVPIYVREYASGSAVTRLAVVTPQMALLEFMIRAVTSPVDRPYMEFFYAKTIEAINLGSAVLAKLPAKAVEKAIRMSPFCLLVQAMGKTNVGPAYVVSIATLLNDIGAGDAESKMIASTPKNYYPSGTCKKDVPVPFDYESSPFFRTDGRLVE